MVKAVTTRSGTRKTPTIKETKKQPPLETNLNKDNTPRTEVSKDTTENSCNDNPKVTSIKEMQSTDPFCKRIMKRLLNKTALKHELNTFFIHNSLLYRYASDHSKDFCTLVIPKAWRYTILVETHDKMGHQGNNRTYSLIKQQLLERNGKGCEGLHPTMSSMLTRESSNTIISITHDGNPRLTFRQNCDGSSH